MAATDLKDEDLSRESIQLRVIEEPLEAFLRAGRKLRVITTTYMAATEPRPPQWLADADEAPDDDDVRRTMMRAGRRVMSKLHRFFEDDERRHEIDRLLQSLDATSATPQPALFPRDARRAPLSAFIEGFSLQRIGGTERLFNERRRRTVRELSLLFSPRVLSDNYISPATTTTSPHP
jgi:hypothetical protein